MSLEFIVSLTDQVSGPAKAATGGLSDLQGALKSTGDASGNAAGGLDKLAGGAAESEAALGPVGIVLMAITAEAAVCAAAIALIWKGGEFALESAEAKNKLTAAFDALGEGKITGQATIAMLDDLGSSIGMTREQLAPFAQKFMAMGITGTEALRKVTLAAASAGALATSGGEAFETMFTKINAAQQTGAALKIPLKGLGSLASMGLNVDDVAKKMGISSAKLGEELKKGTVNAKLFGTALQDALIEKGKGPLEVLGDSMGQMKAAFLSNIAHMFEDVNVAPFVTGLKSIAKLFDMSTASGKTMKLIISTAFNAIFSVASKVFPYIRAFMLGIAIAALKIYIALQPAMDALSELFSGDAGDGSGIIDVLSAIGGGVAWLVTAFTSAFQMIAKAYRWLSNESDILRDDFHGTVADIISTIMGLPAAAIGVATDFVQGLVNGIQNGTGMVIQAVKALGQGAMTALKGILGIASPSKEMAKLGMFTAQGFTAGIDAHAPAANDALNGLVSPTSAGGASPGGGGGKTIKIELGGVVVNISGSPGSTDELVDMLEPAFEQLTERMAMRLGAA